MVKAIVNEVPMVKDLGKDGPVPQEVRDRLENDLGQAQAICGSMIEICNEAIGGDGIDDNLTVAFEAMAYRVARILEPWTGGGFFGDELELSLEPAQPAQGVANA